jgi:hypothetical protein
MHEEGILKTKTIDNADRVSLDGSFEERKRLSEVDRAILAYLVVFSVCLSIFYYILTIRFKSSFIISIIISQIFLNIVCMPTRINFWTELNSSIATYGFIQLATPLVVFVYAIACGLADKKGYCFVKKYCDDVGTP